MKSSSTSWAAALIGTMLAAAPVHAATLVIEGGFLTGAKGVDVGGTLYDVSFQTGSCESLFGGCDDLSDFTFTAPGAADIAAQALLDQVFLDGLGGNFDSAPGLTNGCAGEDFCSALVPFAFQELAVNVMEARNFIADPDDAFGFGSYGTSSDISRQGLTFAVFSPSRSGAVPEPATWGMMMAGFGMVGAAMRRRRRQTVRYAFA